MALCLKHYCIVLYFFSPNIIHMRVDLSVCNICAEVIDLTKVPLKLLEFLWCMYVIQYGRRSRKGFSLEKVGYY
jgi:hypothetical protein